MSTKVTMAAFAAAVVLSGAGSTPSFSTTVNSSQSISINYDFTALLAPPYIGIGVVVGANFLTNATSGTCAGLNVCFQADFFDSTNAHIVTAFAAHAVGVGSETPGLNVPTFTDPIGHLVLSSVGGSVLDVITLNVVLEEPGHALIGPTVETFDVVPTNGTPLPAALPLFAAGLGAVGLLSWRRKPKAAG